MIICDYCRKAIERHQSYITELAQGNQYHPKCYDMEKE
jgi:hypothetical protein